MIYLLYGEDTFRSRKKLAEIIEQYRAKMGSDLNVRRVDAEEEDLAVVLGGVLEAGSLFVQKKLVPFREIIIRFECQEDVDQFAKLTDQNITPLTKYFWYPKMTIERYMDKRYIDEP